jgi:FMN-dependent oxidoreductase (nitrilotriacetate monooxygenase family)
MATLDHLTAGRTGWNIVTSSEDRAAQNYGLDGLPDHDERYRRADEFVEVLEALWDSWEPDARVMDHEAGIYVDHTKVHTVDFEGKWYRSRGPLNTLRSPQGRPVFCQAGSSPTGRDFAARHADTILASVHGLEAMRAYREDMHRRLEAAGRDPGTCKILFVIMPTLGETTAEAADKKARAGRNATAALASMSAITEVDFSVFDLDAPLPDVTTNGHAGYLSEFARFAGQRSTLREALRSWSISCLDLVGEPAEVAEKMAEAMAFIGGDGFLFSGVSSRRYTTELVDGLVPELQKLDVVRRSYDGSTFRENLLSF